MGFRRQARELAMKMLFQIDVGSLSPRDVILHFLEEVKPSEEVSKHAKALTQGVVKEIRAQEGQMLDADDILLVVG